MKKPIEKEIAIEKLLFNDYYVAVYKDQDLVLDRKYYCAGNESALATAEELKKRYPDFEITRYE